MGIMPYSLLNCYGPCRISVISRRNLEDELCLPNVLAAGSAGDQSRESRVFRCFFWGGFLGFRVWGF